MEKPAEKRCSKCGLTFDIVTGFHANTYSGDGRHAYCKKCRSACEKKRYAKNPLVRRQYDLKRKYGLEMSEYETLLASQQYVCAICATERCSTGRRLAVDHCHAVGKLRGLLCTDCNTALGSAKDDTAILFRMMQYLLEWRMEHEVNSGDSVSVRLRPV